MKFARGFLVFSGAAFLFYGLYCLFNPQLLTEYTGMGLSDATAMIEVRAMYGGLQTSMGLFLIYSALHVSRVSNGLLVALFIFVGLAGARAFGMAIDGGDNGYNFIAVTFESICGVICLVLLQRSGNSSEELA
jgi:hypothetical protein